MVTQEQLKRTLRKLNRTLGAPIALNKIALNLLICFNALLGKYLLFFL
jgi:hypothetical protein